MWGVGEFQRRRRAVVTMNRRTFLQAGLGVAMSTRLFAAVKEGKLDAAADILSKAVESKQMHAASLYVQQGDQRICACVRCGEVARRHLSAGFDLEDDISGSVDDAVRPGEVRT